MANEKVKITGYAKREFFDDGIEYRNFSDDLVGFQLTSKGGTPLFTNGNFTITTNLDGKLSKNYNIGEFTEYLSLDTVQTDSLVPNFSRDLKLTLNTDKGDLSLYALFGSLKEFIRVSLEDIILEWPASIFVRDNDLINPLNVGNTVEDYIYDNINKNSTFKISIDRIENKYSLNYDVNGSLSDSFNENNSLRDIVTSFTKYVVDYDNINYEVLGLTGSSSNNNYIYLKVNGNPFPTATSGFTGKYHIRPNNIVVEEFFVGLSDFKSFILDRLTLPKYSSTFRFPVQGDDGVIVFKNEKLTWTTSDGYNLDFNTTQYVNFASKLFNISENYDSNLSDLITRELTSESISDFDTIRGCDGEVIESESQKINRTLRIYGRNYDEINKYIKGISFANVISYNKKDNAPDEIVKNIARVLGWELTNSIVENDLVNTYLVNGEKSYSGQSRGLSKYESEIELWRRLILNTPWLWKSKGTRKAIEFLLEFLGTPKGLVNFNEYVYVVDETLDVNEVRMVMDELFGTREIDTLSIDSDGFPKIQRNGTIINGVETYFQKGGKWYRETSGEESNIDILKGNNPHIGPYDSGKEFLEQLNPLIPNFSAVTLTSTNNFTQNKNIFINYNNGLISDLSVETVIASGSTNIDLESLFNVTSPVGGCVFQTRWELDVFIDNILVGSRNIFETDLESTITLPTDVNFITGATDILAPIDISVYTDGSPISNGDFIFINETDSCETSLFFNREIRLETNYLVDQICVSGTSAIESGFTFFTNNFTYAGSADTYNDLLDENNNQFLNEQGDPCYNLISEIIEDPKPSIEDTECGCEVTDCDQSLKFSIERVPYDVIIYPCLQDNGIVGFEITNTGLISFLDINDNLVNNVSQECCELFGFIYNPIDGLCRCEDPNEPPTVSGLTINLINSTYTFDNNDFINEFSDPDNDNPDTVRILTLPTCGELEYNSTPISVPFEFNYLNSTNLEWVFPNNLVNEPDGNYFYPFDLQTEKNNLISSGYTQQSYSNGVYVFALLGSDLIPIDVDGTFDDFPLTPPTTNFNSNVTGSGWFNGQGSADTHLQPQGNVAKNCPASPQGSVFAGAIAKNQPQATVESFFTRIPLTAGETYVISFYQTHAGDSVGGGAKLGDITNWEVWVDGQVLHSPQMPFQGFGTQTWSYVEIPFQATTTDANAKVEFVGGDGIILGTNTRGCYPAIDDIKFRQVITTGNSTVILSGTPLEECCFTFQTSDDHPTNPLFSNEAEFCISGSVAGCSLITGTDIIPTIPQQELFFINGVTEPTNVTIEYLLSDVTTGDIIPIEIGINGSIMTENIPLIVNTIINPNGGVNYDYAGFITPKNRFNELTDSFKVTMTVTSVDSNGCISGTNTQEFQVGNPSVPVTLILNPIPNTNLDNYSGDLLITGLNGMDELRITKNVPNDGTVGLTFLGSPIGTSSSFTNYTNTNAITAFSNDNDDGVDGETTTGVFTITAYLNNVEVATTGFTLFSNNNANA